MPQDASPLGFVVGGMTLHVIYDMMQNVDPLPHLKFTLAGLVTLLVAAVAPSVAGSIGARIGNAIMFAGFVTVAVGLLPPGNDMPAVLYALLLLIFEGPILWAAYVQVTKGASGGAT